MCGSEEALIKQPRTYTFGNINMESIYSFQFEEDKPHIDNTLNYLFSQLQFK